MSPQEAAQEEVPNNVIYMAEFLMRRRNQAVTEANVMLAKAQKLSKHSDPRQDPFAGVLMKKVDEFAEKADALEKHIKFIVRGGRGAMIPSQRYSTAYGQPSPPPPVKISVSFPAPIK
jgi:hypothetical protein